MFNIEFIKISVLEGNIRIVEMHNEVYYKGTISLLM